MPSPKTIFIPAYFFRSILRPLDQDGCSSLKRLNPDSLFLPSREPSAPTRVLRLMARKSEIFLSRNAGTLLTRVFKFVLAIQITNVS